ncbi:Uncharacterised protein [Mycolicibacterium vanbaalenii]|uniref:Tail assembly chaperone n=1 Tax=Mycolicibacterium vanbaalenii TaxID=110539 RepID=A0A5S9R8C6_MYCVN|nr:hypothetical protein [Mycolicibacterium vanbaalenii]CAA0134537.1 Uncharacterised protein [Mycolicibacterium vanbaalenii]
MTIYASDDATKVAENTEPDQIEPVRAEVHSPDPDGNHTPPSYPIDDEPEPADETDEPEDADGEPEDPAEPDWSAEPDWEHDHVEFHGDLLAFRVPAQSAVTSLGIGAGPGSTPNEQSFYARYFLSTHLSSQSFQRFLMRSIQPDGYPAEVTDPQGDLVNAISKPLLDRLEAEAKARKTAPKGKK